MCIRDRLGCDELVEAGGHDADLDVLRYQLPFKYRHDDPFPNVGFLSRVVQALGRLALLIEVQQMPHLLLLGAQIELIVAGQRLSLIHI